MNINAPPPLPEERLAVYEYYRLAFDLDGCPMKRMTDGQLVFHPLLPAYLIVDYITCFCATKDPLYLACAIQIAKLALKKADAFKNALVFWYNPETKLSYVPGIYYSALTQAWYIKALCMLQPHCLKQDSVSWNAELKALFNSFLISTDDGGVLIKKPCGWTVEEYPHTIPFYTLNGWLTTLRILHRHRTELLDADINVDAFLAENLKALRTLLPLYDAPFCFNSRYQLAGFTRLKIVFDREVPYDLSAFSVELPGDGVFTGELIPASNKWSNYLEKREPRMLQFSIVQSLASAPRNNIFRCTLKVGAQCAAKVFCADGDYQPNLSGMPTKRWRQIGVFRMMPDRQSDYLLELPFDGKDCFAYPTNFKKIINGKHYNAYHFVHIIALAELYSTYRHPILKHYVMQWLGYVNKWPSLPWLTEGNYSHSCYPHGPKLAEIVQNYLSATDAQPNYRCAP